jgi:hypothetical protein
MRTWRRVVIVLAVLGTAFLFYRWWQTASSRAQPRPHGDLDPGPEQTLGASAGQPPGPGTHAGDTAPAEGRSGPPMDRARADRMREQIRALFAEAGPMLFGSAASAAPSASAAPAFPTMPLNPRADAGESTVDPDYIRNRIHEDLFPLAKDCYGDALKRNPKAAGRIEVYFKVIGDKKVGGVVDEVKLLDGTTLDDAEMQTCVRESMMSVSFDAPPGDGELTVIYPIEFSPDEPEAGSSN